MKEKKKLIIESAIKLFAEHGFYNTSVQEIATHANVSKGAVYLYFKSKEELLLNIFYYYSDIIREKVNSAENLNINPKELLIKQIEIHLEEIFKHSEFFIMHMREQALPFHNDLHKFMKKIRTETLSSYKVRIKAHYGDIAEPYIIDLCLLLDGLIQTYVKLFIIDQINLDFHTLATYIVRRFDDIVTWARSI